MTYTADNMIRFLGSEGTDEDAQRMGEYLESQGWELSLRDGEFVAYRQDAEDGWREMTEQEWQDALHLAFEEGEQDQQVSYLDAECTSHMPQLSR